MIDLVGQLNAAHRKLSGRSVETGEARAVLVRRDYDAPVEDVWDACVNPDRLKRWLGPVSGELKLGGNYQIEGNASGTIIRCEPPRLLAVTWIGPGGDDRFSEVEVRLSDNGDRTTFELEHAADVDPEFWDKYGPGAVGIGWDLALLGLAAHLSGNEIDNPDEALLTPEGVDFMTRSSLAWRDAHEAAGASPEEAASAAQETLAFYTTPPELP